jgi:GGDEF domain-containing protein
VHRIDVGQNQTRHPHVPSSRDASRISQLVLALDGAEAHQDPLTGLYSLAQLIARLEEIYQHCANRNVTTSSAFALLVIEPDLDSVEPVVRDAVRVLLADEVRRSFAEAETQAAIGQRIVVLAAHTSGLSRAASGLARRLRRHGALKHRAIRMTIEPLPDDASRLAQFLVELGLERPNR